MTTTPKLRERAVHSKSRNGCSPCKKAHRRCDLAKPTCGRCSKNQQPCLYETIPVSKFRGVKFVTFEEPRSVSQINNAPPIDAALQYFQKHTIPILQACRASPLWDYLLQHIKQKSHGSNLQAICRAIGAHHSLADADHSPSSEVLQAADVAYGEALHCLQTLMSTKEARTVAVLGCLLMCILETLRGPSQALLQHIYCGVRILQESDETMSLELHDASQLIRRYAVAATLFDPLSDGARRILNLLEGSPGDSSFPLDVSDRQVQLTLDLVHLIALHGTRTSDLSASLQELRNRHGEIEREIDTRLAASDTSDGKALALLQLAKAASLAQHMFLAAAWDDLQLSYDLHLDDCRTIVALIHAALPTFYSSGSSATERRSGPPAFSVGLFTQLKIMVVATQCRDQDTRAAALALLDHCPRKEGVFDATLVKDISRTIKYCEEQRAGARGMDIPEACRVHHHLLLQPADGTRPAVLRVFFSPLSAEKPDYFDQALIRG